MRCNLLFLSFLSLLLNVCDSNCLFETSRIELNLDYVITNAYPGRHLAVKVHIPFVSVSFRVVVLFGSSGGSCILRLCLYVINVFVFLS